jgi:heme exporter protein B
LIRALIKKEINLEIRRKTVISGLLVYLISTVFISYIAFGFRVIDPTSWSALFWITLLFTTVSTVAKSFIGERKGKDMYFYSIVSPEAFIVAKICYNFFLCAVLSFAGFGFFSLFLSNPVDDLLLFGVTILLSSLGFAASLTLLSAIAAKANNSNILMSVLSFPVIISILLVSIKITKNCIDGLDRSASSDELIILAAINCLVAAISYLLFPYIWRS